jgi:hypothetical protein
VDFDGGLFSQNPIFHGAYHLNGAFLSVIAKGGREYVGSGECGHETDRATTGAGDRLALARVGGCPDDAGSVDPGSVWIGMTLGSGSGSTSGCSRATSSSYFCAESSATSACQHQ